MLTRLIVASYAWLLEAALWLTLALSSVAGYHVTVPLMNDAGAVPTYELAWKLFGALLFPILTFLALAVLIGPLLILVDIRQAARHIEARLARGEDLRTPLPLERREPTL